MYAGVRTLVVKPRSSSTTSGTRFTTHPSDRSGSPIAALLGATVATWVEGGARLLGVQDLSPERRCLPRTKRALL
jgi:hypothetical protein